MDLPGLMIFWTVWCSTAIILCDAGCRRIEGYSLLGVVTASGTAVSVFVATGIGSGLFLDGTAQWLGKLWIYPYWTPGLYGACFVVGFCAYWLLLAETYFLARSMLRPLFPCRAVCAATRPKRFAGLLGFGLGTSGLVLAIRDYAGAGGYQFRLTAPAPAHSSFPSFLALLAGAWLILEFITGRRRRLSLLQTVRQRNFLPLCAILTAGWIFGFLMETANAADHFWRYTNWPLPQAGICGVPVMVLLLWPAQYVIFLSLFCVLGGSPVWE